MKGKVSEIGGVRGWGDLKRKVAVLFEVTLHGNTS